jgi:hypothetical protein
MTESPQRYTIVSFHAHPDVRMAELAASAEILGCARRRALDLFVGLPLAVFWLVFGREWYVDEHGRVAPSRLNDVFASPRVSAQAPREGQCRTSGGTG